MASKDYVLEEITKAQLAGGEVDLSNYYTKEEIDTKIPDVSNYATTEYVAEAQKAMKADLEKMVDEKIAEEIVSNAIEYGTF